MPSPMGLLPPSALAASALRPRMTDEQRQRRAAIDWLGQQSDPRYQQLAQQMGEAEPPPPPGPFGRFMRKKFGIEDSWSEAWAPETYKPMFDQARERSKVPGVETAIQSALTYTPQHALSLGRGLVGLGNLATAIPRKAVDAALPGQPMKAITSGISDKLEDMEAGYAEWTEGVAPTDPDERQVWDYARMGTAMGMTLVEFMAAGYAVPKMLLKGASKIATRFPKLSAAITRFATPSTQRMRDMKTGQRLREVGKTAGYVGALDLMYAQNPETSPTYLLGTAAPKSEHWLLGGAQKILEPLGSTTVGRLVGDVALGAVGDLGIRSLVRGGARTYRGAKEGAVDALDPSAIRDVAAFETFSREIPETVAPSVRPVRPKATDESIATKAEELYAVEATGNQVEIDIVQRDLDDMMDEFSLSRAGGVEIDPDPLTLSPRPRLEEEQAAISLASAEARAAMGRQDTAIHTLLDGTEDLGLDKSPLVDEVARAIEARALKRNGGRILDLTEDKDRISTIVADEVELAESLKNNSLEWYSADLEEAMQMWARVAPEFTTDPVALEAGRFSLAITSNQTKVALNAENARKIYDAYRASATTTAARRFPTDMGWGKGSDAMKQAFTLWNRTADQIGVENTMKLLDTKMPVREMGKLGFTITGEAADEVLPVAVAFGAKIGSFYRNLGNFLETLTMDRWDMRGLGRITGRIVKHPTAATSDAATERLINTLAKRPELKGKVPADEEGLLEAARSLNVEWEATYRKRKEAALVAGERPEWSKAATNYIEKFDPPIRDAPTSPGERQAIREIYRLAQSKLKETTGTDYEIATMQAARWFPEKRLYRQLGVRGDPAEISFADAFKAHPDIRTDRLKAIIGDDDLRGGLSRFRQARRVPEERQLAFEKTETERLGGPDEIQRSVDEKLVARGVEESGRLAGQQSTNLRSGLGTGPEDAEAWRLLRNTTAERKFVKQLESGAGRGWQRDAGLSVTVDRPVSGRYTGQKGLLAAKRKEDMPLFYEDLHSAAQQRWRNFSVEDKAPAGDGLTKAAGDFISAEQKRLSLLPDDAPIITSAERLKKELSESHGGTRRLVAAVISEDETTVVLGQSHTRALNKAFYDGIPVGNDLRTTRVFLDTETLELLDRRAAARAMSDPDKAYGGSPINELGQTEMPVVTGEQAYSALGHAGGLLADAPVGVEKFLAFNRASLGRPKGGLLFPRESTGGLLQAITGKKNTEALVRTMEDINKTKTVSGDRFLDMAAERHGIDPATITIRSEPGAGIYEGTITPNQVVEITGATKEQTMELSKTAASLRRAAFDQEVEAGFRPLSRVVENFEQIDELVSSSDDIHGGLRVNVDDPEGALESLRAAGLDATLQSRTGDIYVINYKGGTFQDFFNTAEATLRNHNIKEIRAHAIEGFYLTKEAAGVRLAGDEFRDVHRLLLDDIAPRYEKFARDLGIDPAAAKADVDRIAATAERLSSPDVPRGEGTVLYSTPFHLLKPTAATHTGALFGAAIGGATAEVADENPAVGALYGAAIGGGGVAAARQLIPALKNINTAAIGKLDAIRAQRRQVTNAEAKSATFGGDGSIDAKVLTKDAKVSAARRIWDSIAKPGMNWEGASADRLLTWFQRLRAGVIRGHTVVFEQMDEVGRNVKNIIGDPIGNAAGVLRGTGLVSDVYLIKNLRPLIRAHGPAGTGAMDSAAVLSTAQRRIELSDLHEGKVPPAQLKEASDAIAELQASLSPEDWSSLYSANEALQGYYRDLLRLKRDHGLITRQQYDDIVAQGQYYIPFLSEDLARLTDVGAGKSPYVANTEVGVRRMTDMVDEAVHVDPWQQAVIDTHKTHMLIHRQNLTNLISSRGHMDGFKQWIRHLPEKPTDASGRLATAREGVYVEARTKAGKRTWYHVLDPDLADAWSAIGSTVADPFTMRVLSSIRQVSQAGITLEPIFALVNAFRDFVTTMTQIPFNKGIPGLQGLRASTQITGGAAVGAVVAPEEERMKGALVGATAVASPHLAMHIGRVGSAMFDIVGSHNVGMITGAFGGYVSAGKDADGKDILVRIAAGAAGGRGLGLAALWKGLPGAGTRLGGALRGDPRHVEGWKASGGASFGLYAPTKEGAKRMLDDMLHNGVDPGDILQVDGWGDAIRMFMQPLNIIFNAAQRGESPLSLAKRVALDPLTALGRTTETASRLATFKHHVRSAGPKGENWRARDARVQAEYDAAIQGSPSRTITDAAMTSRDASLDFNVHGTFQLAKWLTSTTKFLNPTLLGFDKYIRMAKDPEMAAVGGATIVAPSILLWMWNHSDPEVAAEYASRPQWERNSNWLVSKKLLASVGIGDGTDGFYRATKPFEMGFAYASIPERALDAAAEYNEIGLQLDLADAMGEAGDILLDFRGSFMSPSTPMVVGQMWQAGAGEHGYNLFTKRPIDPYPWLDISQSEQQSAYTSSLAIWAERTPVVGDILAAAGFDSPAKIDFFVRELGGKIVSHSNRVLTDIAHDVGWDTRPRGAEFPSAWQARFETNPQTATQPEMDFRETFGRTAEAWNTVRHLENTDPVRLQELIATDIDFSKDLILYDMGRSHKKRIDDLTKARREIRTSPDPRLTPELKALLIAELSLTLANASTEYLRSYKLMKRNLDNLTRGPR